MMQKKEPGERAALNARDTAARYSIAVRTLYKLVDSGDMPPGIKLGKSRRWLVKDLEQWEAARSNTAAKGGRHVA